MPKENAFFRPWRHDGRWLVLIFLCIYFAFIFAAHFAVDYRIAWRWLGVPAQGLGFVDLRLILDGAKTMRDGVDPLVRNLYGPVTYPVDYPHVWFQTVLALHLLDLNPVGMAVCICLSFYACVFAFAGRLTAAEGFVWSFFLCAPPTMLAIERANNDLLVFDLIAIALILRGRPGIGSTLASYGLVEICAMLKLFPVAAFSLALREKRRIAFTILLLGGLIFAGYLYLIRDQLAVLRAAIPKPFAVAYGKNVYVSALRARPIPMVLSTFVLAASLLLACIGAWRARPLPALSPRKLDGLLVGSSLYLFTFVLNNNFNYRLIFLLFTLPALIELLREYGFYRRFALAMLILMAVGWAFSAAGQRWIFLIKELLNWSVFTGMVILWLRAVPWRDFSGADRTAHA